MKQSLRSSILTWLLIVGVLFLSVGYAQTDHVAAVRLNILSSGPQNTSAELLKEHLELFVDGKREEILDVVRDASHLSLVFVVITNPWGCIDSHIPFASSRQFDKTFLKSDDVAIVVSDQRGEIIREFGKDRSSFIDDMAEAVKRANGNSYESFNSETQATEAKAGIVYPMAALRSAVELLKKSPIENEKHIILISDLRNTEVGSSSEARATFSDLVEHQISVSWLLNDPPRKTFSANKISYGKRSYFLDLPFLTGGSFQSCNQRANLWSVIRGRDGDNYSTFEDGIESLLESKRNRYLIKYRQPNTSIEMSHIEVKVSKRSPLKNELRFTYPKMMQY